MWHLLMAWLAAAQPTTASLRVDFSGIEEVRGSVYLTVFNQEKGWPDQSAQAVRSAIVPVSATSVSYRLQGLPPGTYAIAAFHDVNGNGKMDTNRLGIPTEPYGFSRNARGTFGPPDYEDCLLTIAKAHYTSIVLK